VEHGAFEHGGGDAAGFEHDGASMSATADREAHESCAFGDALIRSAASPSYTDSVRVGTADHVPVFPSIELPPVDILAAAPKTSPPQPVS
jgi:hypothetical protein